MDKPTAKKKTVSLEADTHADNSDETQLTRKGIPQVLLNSLFAGTIVSWLLVGAIVLVTAVVCSGGQTGCGDIFLLAAPIVLVIWALTFLYPIAVIVSVIIDLQNKREVSRINILGVAIVLLLGFMPQLGPFSHFVSNVDNSSINESSQQADGSTENIPVQF